MSIYQKLNAKFPDQERGHHESDLYIKHSAEIAEFLKSEGVNFETFYSAIDRSKWIDIPFMYDPFWEHKMIY
jgi:hypothetical protein